MPATLLTWRKSDLYTITETLAGFLAGLKAAIDAEVAANPSAALWEVADYDGTDGTLVIKNTAAGIAAGGSANRRLMLFGGVAPNTAAIDGATSNTSSLYCGVAPSAGVDAPQQAYGTGVPFTTGAWVPGGILTTVFTLDKVEYYETAAGMVIVFREGSMTGATNNLSTAILGALAVTMDGESERDIAVGSAGLWVANADTTPGGTGLYIPSANPTGSVGYVRANYLDPDDGVVRCIRLFTGVLAGDTAGIRGVGSTRFFFPIPLRDVNNNYLRIRLRQIGVGLRDVHGSTMSDADGIRAYKIGARTDTAEDGPWLLNSRI